MIYTENYRGELRCSGMGKQFMLH